jgi:signal peptidase I
LALTARRVVGAYEVLSASMLPTLEPGDMVAGNRLAYGWHAGGTLPKRGDIVVFHRADAGEESSSAIVKRVIGLPGDRISMKDATPVINGWEVPKCDAGLYIYPLKEGGAAAARLFVEFLDDRAYLMLRTALTPHWSETYVVKPGEVFVLGDNRDISFDSRAWNGWKGDGLAITAIDARAERSLYGLKRSGRADLVPLLRRLDPGVRLDGLDTTELRYSIAHCLEQRPAQTRPPAAHGS